MDGLECSEIQFSDIDLGDRIDSEYYTKNYIHISDQLSKVNTDKLGNMVSIVASAFYPAATHLYSEGNIPFARCVDCVSYPIITADQDNKFEKIPLKFGEENKGISFIKKNEIIITKVGTPCYASILTDYEEIALSRTVLGLTHINHIEPNYLMIFLRCKYGFEQLFRQRELTIQYQLTLPRVRAIDVYLAGLELQQVINHLCSTSKDLQQKSNSLYYQSENILMSYIGVNDIANNNTWTIQSYNKSYEKTGRLDAEYYQPKYDNLFNLLGYITCKPLGGDRGLVNIKKSIEPGSEYYQSDGVPFIRVSDISKFEIEDPEIHLPLDIVDNIEDLYPEKDTILFSKDGSVGIAYKVEDRMEIITSGALLHLTINNQDEILPDYLTLVLNSPIVQLQAERDTNGAIIQHWKPSEIEKVVIPVLDMDKQIEISDKVKESFALRKKSKQLLEDAKRAVELAIEQDEESAIEWLKDRKKEAGV